MKKIFTAILAAVMLVATLAACGGGAPAQPDAMGEAQPFRVGAIYPLSGANALLGRQCLDAVRIAVDFINEQGGVHGRPVELFEADAPDPTAAATEAGRLIDQVGVEVIFGSLASGNSMAIAGVADRSRVHLVESGGIADQITQSGFRYVYRILDMGSLRGASGAAYLEYLAGRLDIALGDLRVAILHEDTSFGVSVGIGANARLAEMGAQVVFSEQYSAQIASMSALVLRIREAQPDVLITVSYINDAILLVDTLQQYGALPAVFMGFGAGTTDPNFAMTIGDVSDGMFSVDMPTNLPLSVFDSDPQLRATVERFREAWLAKNPEMINVSVAAEAAFAGAYTFMNEILPRATSLDPQDVRYAALNTTLPLTPLGFGWNLGEDGQNYAANANVNQWQGGEIVTVYPEHMRTGEIINVPLPVSR